MSVKLRLPREAGWADQKGFRNNSRVILALQWSVWHSDIETYSMNAHIIVDNDDSIYKKALVSIFFTKKTYK